MPRNATRTTVSLLVLLLSFQAAAEAVRSPALGSGELLVGSKRGLEVWSADGKVRRTIVRSPAPHPRWLDPAHVLVVEGADSSGDPDQPLRLSRVDLVEGKVHPVAEAQPVRCLNEKRSPEVPVDMFALREEDDFVVDLARNRACLKVATGAEAMSILVTFDLRSGTSRQIVTAWEERCRLPAGTTARGLQDEDYCQTSPTIATPTPRATGAFVLRKDTLLEHKSGRKRPVVVGRLATYKADSVSPSRRWLLLSGELESGDSVHRKLVLVDTQVGGVFALSRRPGQWPPPIPPDAEKRFRVPVAAWIASGESDIRWIGSDEPNEMLVVDDLVFRPGVSIFSVDGHVAR